MAEDASSGGKSDGAKAWLPIPTRSISNIVRDVRDDVTLWTVLEWIAVGWVIIMSLLLVAYGFVRLSGSLALTFGISVLFIVLVLTGVLASTIIHAYFQ